MDNQTLSYLKRNVKDFDERRYIKLPISLRAAPIAYDDPRFTEGFVLEKDRTFPFEISDESEDSHGTVFYSAGWDLSYRVTNKAVKYNHPDIGDTNPDLVIGRGTEYIQDSKLYSTLVLEPHGTDNRVANAICNKLHFGSITDASVEAYILDGHPGDESRGEDPAVFYFTKQLLLGWSVVMHGSNSNAKVKRSLADCAESFGTKQAIDNTDLIESQRLMTENILKSRHICQS